MQLHSTGCSCLILINDRVFPVQGPRGFLSSWSLASACEMESLATDLMLEKELRTETGGTEGRGLSFVPQNKTKKTPTCCLFSNTSGKLHPSVFICIAYELLVYLFAAPASLLLQKCGNKMIIYRHLNACFAGLERWISRSWVNWQSSGSVIEEAGGRKSYLHTSH